MFVTISSGLDRMFWSYVLGSKLPIFPYNRGWSSTQVRRGLYTIIRIPYFSGWMTIPNTIDHGTYVVYSIALVIVSYSWCVFHGIFGEMLVGVVRAKRETFTWIQSGSPYQL